MTLIIETDNDVNAKMLAAMLEKLNFVKAVSLSPLTTVSFRSKASSVFMIPNSGRKKKQKPLTGKDWILSGRSATEQELEELAKQMEEQTTGGVDASLFFKQMKSKLNR